MKRITLALFAASIALFVLSLANLSRIWGPPLGCSSSPDTCYGSKRQSL